MKAQTLTPTLSPEDRGEGEQPAQGGARLSLAICGDTPAPPRPRPLRHRLRRHRLPPRPGVDARAGRGQDIGYGSRLMRVVGGTVARGAVVAARSGQVEGAPGRSHGIECPTGITAESSGEVEWSDTLAGASWHPLDHCRIKWVRARSTRAISWPSRSCMTADGSGPRRPPSTPPRPHPCDSSKRLAPAPL
jgi:hypothetical protein